MKILDLANMNMMFKKVNQSLIIKSKLIQNNMNNKQYNKLQAQVIMILKYPKNQKSNIQLEMN